MQNKLPSQPLVSGRKPGLFLPTEQEVYSYGSAGVLPADAAVHAGGAPAADCHLDLLLALNSFSHVIEQLNN